jgi:hypothetical protein
MLAAVDALASAAEDLERLRDDDPRLRRLARAWNRLDHQQRMLASTEQRRAIRQAGMTASQPRPHCSYWSPWSPRQSCANSTPLKWRDSASRHPAPADRDSLQGSVAIR